MARCKWCGRKYNDLVSGWCGIKCQEEHREHDPIGYPDILKSKLRLDKIWDKALLVIVPIIIIVVIFGVMKEKGMFQGEHALSKRARLERESLESKIRSLKAKD